MENNPPKKENKFKSLTILIPAGRPHLDLLDKILNVAKSNNLEVYLTTRQNLRLNNIPEKMFDSLKTELEAQGAQFKGPGKFPIPKVCVGKPHCNLALIDTDKVSQKITDYFSQKKYTKEKIKIALAACNLACSETRTCDIGIELTRKGYTVYVGGKTGISPKIGMRIKRDISETKMLEVLENLMDYHDLKTGKKNRMFKLLTETDFPYTPV